VIDVASSSAVVILCGGVSRRLGVSKALLQVQGKPLFNLVAENLSSLGLPVYLVSKVALETQDVPLILDTFSEDTPLAGVLTALCSLPYSNYVFSGVDMPLVNGEMVMPLLEYASSEECSAFYTVNGFLQPFPSVLRADAVGRILECYNNGFYKLTEVFSSIPHVLLPYTGDLNVLLNVNTWKDWESFQWSAPYYFPMRDQFA